jgi:SAM-dependent methyltransferase
MTSNRNWKAALPSPLLRWLRGRRLPFERLRRRLGLGPGRSLLRRTAPINASDYGESRGQCIDRYYIEKFLTTRAADVQGHVLDFCDDTYARKFGGARAAAVDVLHLSADNPCATIVADLTCAGEIPCDTFDCILCLQVLHCIFDVHAAIRTLYRVLRPGGVVLVSVPGIQKIDSVDMQDGQEYWRFTSLAIRRLFEEVFPKGNVEVTVHGNVLAAIAFLHGLAVEDLRREDLDYRDRDYEVSITLRAVKPNLSSTPQIRS